MQKIGDTTKTADSNGEFTDGDPQKQIPCTWIMAAWLTTLQREVIKVVQEGGLTLNPKDDTQLYQAIEALMGAKVEGVVKSVNAHNPDTHGNVALPDASTTEKGLAQYSSATNSTSEALAATPKAVKAAYDLAAAALPKTGGTLTGGLNVEGKISLSDGLELGNQKAASPAYIDFHTDGKATDYNARIISPQNSTEINLIAANNDNNGSGIIRMLGNKADQLSFALQGTAHSALALRKWGNTQRPTVLELDVDGGIWLMSIDHTEANKAALGVNGTVNAEILNASNKVQVGGARMTTDGNIWGTRWNGNGAWLWDTIVSQINGIGQVSVSGNQWWAKINLNGTTLIFQGGRAVGSVADDGITERVGLNISVPNRLLHVSITVKNFAQGYQTTWTPQVGDLSSERDGFNWFHGTQERDMYWFAVGY